MLRLASHLLPGLILRSCLILLFFLWPFSVSHCLCPLLLTISNTGLVIVGLLAGGYTGVPCCFPGLHRVNSPLIPLAGWFFFYRFLFVLYFQALLMSPSFIYSSGRRVEDFALTRPLFAPLYLPDITNQVPSLPLWFPFGFLWFPFGSLWFPLGIFW